MVGFGALAVAPTLAAIAVFQVLRRAGDYAIARPTREVLFTVVPREDRYKAKSFIDTFVYRLGDQVGAWGVAGFLRGLGAGAAELALIAIPIALLWLLNALWLGRRQEKMATARSRCRIKFRRLRRGSSRHRASSRGAGRAAGFRRAAGRDASCRGCPR